MVDFKNPFDELPRTQTKALFEKLPPQKLAPPSEVKYSLGLVKAGEDRAWITRLLREITNRPSCHIPSRPSIVASGLNRRQAIKAWESLTLTNSISMYIDEEELPELPPHRMERLLSGKISYDDYRLTKIRVERVPDGIYGREFLVELFGKEVALPHHDVATLWKACLMRERAEAICAIAVCDGEVSPARTV